MTTPLRRAARGARTAMIGAAVAASATLALPAPAHAAGSTSNPFAVLASPSTVGSTHVGRSAAGVPIGISYTADGTAVAYLCDGTGKVSTWFTGTFDNKSGVAKLRSTDGASVTYDVGKRTGTLTLKGAASALKLQPATGVAGIYRENQSKGATTGVAGWVVTNEGFVTGQLTVAGKPVKTAAVSLTTPLPPTPVTTATAPTTTIAVEVFSKRLGLRCGLLSFRVGFNNARGNTDRSGELVDRQIENDCVPQID